MKPDVRPAPSERSIANQLYSEFVPCLATAAAQAGFLGTIWPVDVSPSFQHRYWRLPGCIIAPCAEAGAANITTAPDPASTAASHSASLLRRFIPTFYPIEGSPLVGLKAPDQRIDNSETGFDR